MTYVNFNTSTQAQSPGPRTSPYLLQHAYNPVDWYPWGPEAFDTTRQRNCPILLSIGYSACHWCHVMERESFENEAIAALMNRWFVCIKVDREDDQISMRFMAATVAMNHGQGGWPMTVFLTPEQQPFFAGTYFPPAGRWGRPGFPDLLQQIADVWKQDPNGVRSQAQDMTARLQREWQTLLQSPSVRKFLMRPWTNSSRNLMHASVDSGCSKIPACCRTLSPASMLPQERQSYGAADGHDHPRRHGCRRNL